MIPFPVSRLSFLAVRCDPSISVSPSLSVALDCDPILDLKREHLASAMNRRQDRCMRLFSHETSRASPSFQESKALSWNRPVREDQDEEVSRGMHEQRRTGE